MDDAEPVPPQTWEVEAGGRYIRDHSMAHYDAPFTLTYGLIPRLELGAGFGGQLHEAEEFSGLRTTHGGWTDVTLGTKVKLLDKDRFWADHSLAGTVKIPTADHERGLGTGGTDYSLAWVATKPLSDRWGLHWNLGYTWIEGSDADGLWDLFHYGVAADYAIGQTLQLVTEVFANTPAWEFSETAVVINGGCRWRASENFVLDAAVGGGVHGPAPQVIATLGITWTFRLW